MSDDDPGPVDFRTLAGTCYRCGIPGHWARNCPGKQAAPHRSPSPPEPPPTARPGPQGKDPALIRRPVEDIADPAPWANAIRERHGWPARGEASEQLARQEALRQLTELRQCRVEGMTVS